MSRFEGQVVVVTGAAGQIGSACARAFSRDGARVVATDRAMDAVPTGALLEVDADLARPDEIERLFDAVEDRFGPVDVLVQSAAVHRRLPFLEITPANIDDVLDINVRAILLAARRAAAGMVSANKPGAIVNLTSVSGVVSDAESVAYEASKGAVTMATKGMAVALAQHGIRVAAVGPGSMAKFQELPPRDPFDLDAYERRRIPLGRLGTADDIAAAVQFLASPEAAYITGTVLYVDGGCLAAW